MKLMFVLMAFLAIANAGSVREEMTRLDKWARRKAMKACFGAEATDLWTAKMKAAIQKCSGTESPELELPLFKDPARMINALMMGVKEREKAKLVQFASMAAGNQKLTRPFAAPAQTMTLVPYPVQSIPQKQQSTEENFVMKMMEVMMMKTMMNKLSDDDTTFFEDMGEDDENEIMRFAFDIQADFEDLLKALFETRNRLRRHKRATDADLLDIGERLVEKLKLEQEKMKMKWGNKSCVLQEVGVIDSDRNLNLNEMLRHTEQSPIKDDWLKKEKTKALRMCYTRVESLPREVLEECVDEKWLKIKEFLSCMNRRRMKACMACDIRDRLETEFGTIEKLEEDTGMDEKTLLMLTRKIFYDDM